MTFLDRCECDHRRVFHLKDQAIGEVRYGECIICNCPFYREKK